MNAAGNRKMAAGMKRFSIITVLFLTAWTSFAQTNATSAVREMSLPDCIQEAMQHNLDMQIQRYNPQISLYNLNANYGGYDPTFNFSGTHNYNDSGGTFQNGQHVAGSGIQLRTVSVRVSTARCRGARFMIWAAMFRAQRAVNSDREHQFYPVPVPKLLRPGRRAHAHPAVAEEFLD